MIGTKVINTRQQTMLLADIFLQLRHKMTTLFVGDLDALDGVSHSLPSQD